MGLLRIASGKLYIIGIMSRRPILICNSTENNIRSPEKGKGGDYARLVLDPWKFSAAPELT
jgi:hypothetical protein